MLIDFKILIIYFLAVCTSVADQDQDLVGSGLFGHPDLGKYRIRILYPQKANVIQILSYIKLSKIQFCPNNIYIFDFKCHKMSRFG